MKDEMHWRARDNGMGFLISHYICTSNQDVNVAMSSLEEQDLCNLKKNVYKYQV